MKEKNELDILIPVFNESENIVETLKNIFREFNNKSDNKNKNNQSLSYLHIGYYVYYYCLCTPGIVKNLLFSRPFPKMSLWMYFGRPLAPF